MKLAIVQRAGSIGLVFLASVLHAAAAHTQDVGRPWDLECETRQIENQHWVCRGSVVFSQGQGENDTRVYADELEWFRDEDRAVLTGNVVYRQGRSQISADRAELNTRTRLGKFFHAAGTSVAQPQRRSAPAPGMFIAPEMVGQQTDVYFFGDVVEKLAPKKYRITNGGFTTCVQPTPRWELHAGSMTLNVDDHALLWNSVFNVKNVPLLYLPVVYYPTSEDNRSTGFLLPTYENSNVNGRAIKNAFFWAIGRSHDATFFYDWFSKLGAGGGAEYRYNVGSGVGNITSYLLDQNPLTQLDGTTSPAQRTYKVYGSANQRLPGRFQARADVNYFSNVATHQAFMTNVNDFSQSRRSYGVNVAGSRGHYSLNGTFQRSEWFSTLASSNVTGSTPLISLTQSDRPLFGAISPLYFSFGSEFAHLDRETLAENAAPDDRSLSRFDVSPRIRYPFKRWQWLTVNSSLLFRDTYYTRSQDPLTGVVLEDDLNRSYVTVDANVTGPVFNRVWDTPANGYAEKFKHTVEPFMTVQRTTSIDNFNQVVQGVDATVIGGVTSVAYGVNNRLYAKRKFGTTSQAQQIASLGITQTYYTNPVASSFDPNYGSSFSGTNASNFSAIKMDLNVSPTTAFTSTLRAEIDPTYREFRTLGVGARHVWAYGTNDVSWNQRFFVANVSGFDDPNAVSRALSATSNVHTSDYRYGGTYTFVFDAAHSTIVQQSVQAFYNAQCCGVSMQYSRASNAGAYVNSNNKFLFSVTLAGLGSFSPLDGGLGAIPR
jgi:LPS-assembly protein